MVDVVSKEYIDNQKQIIALQQEWKSQIDKETLFQLPQITMKPDIPLSMQVDMNIDYTQYVRWVHELCDLLVKVNPQLQEQGEKIISMLDSAIAQTWIHEAITFNQTYFHSFADQHGIHSWLPYFLAEQALRPYLRELSTKYKVQLEKQAKKQSCPCCGEPVRLAKLEGKGKKMLTCPRCYTAWYEKRTVCSHCGENSDEATFYLTAEDHKHEQIHICKSCNQYVKVIDSRKTLYANQPDLMDIMTIHLDLIAAQRGYGDSNDQITH